MRTLIVLALLTTSAYAGELTTPRNKAKYNQQIQALTDAISTACGCQIDGISIGSISSRSSWRIDFHNSAGPDAGPAHGDATDDQVAKAYDALKTFDFP